MLKFLKNLTLIIVGYTIFAFSISTILYHSGFVTPRDEPLAELKLEAIQAGEYSLLMVGSSRFYRHLDSELIEDGLQAKGYDFSVYNLGIPGLWPPRQDKFLTRVEEVSTPKVLLVELSMPRSLFGNLRSGSVIRSVDLAVALNALSISSETASDTKTSLRFGSSYLAALLYKYSGIGLFRFSLSGQADMIERAKTQLSHSENGYLSLDREEILGRGAANQRMPATQSELRKLQDDNTRKYNDNPSKLSPTLMAKCQASIDRAASQGCRLIFVLSPRVGKSQLAAIYPVFRELPSNHKVDLSDPVEYPEFYSANYSFDRGHLNEAGAQLMSAALAEKLDQLLKDSKMKRPATR